MLVWKEIITMNKLEIFAICLIGLLIFLLLIIFMLKKKRHNEIADRIKTVLKEEKKDK